jgi:hypothetical protein
VASSAGARPVECSTQSNERCSAGRLAPSGFLSQRWGLPPPHPAFRFAWLVLQTARYRGKQSAWQVWAAAPHTPAFRCARLVFQTARYRGQRSAWQVWAAAPTPRFPLRSACLADGSLPRATKRLAGVGCRPHTPLSAALGLSCKRLATAGSEALSILRAHLRTRKAIRCRSLQRRNVRCALRRLRAGESFYRSRGEPPELPLSAALGFTCGRVLPRETNAAMTTVASNFSRRCTHVMAIGILASD